MSSLRYFSLLLPLALTVVGCGGQIVQDPQDPNTSSIPSSAETAPFDPNQPNPEPEEGEWGTWQLLSVEDASGKRQYDPPFIEVDLRPDGTAYLWTCIARSTGNGERCPAPYRQTCHKGTFTISGTTWRVQLTNRDGTQIAGRGDVTEEASGDIGIDGSGVLPAKAHYRRVGAPTHEGCLP
jgi:hypothetical protein